MKLKYTMVQVRSPLKSHEPLHVSSCLRVKCSAATERVELCLERSHNILTWFLAHHLEVSMYANTLAKIMLIITNAKTNATTTNKNKKQQSSKEVQKSNFQQYGQMKSRAGQRQREEKDQKRQD